MSGAAIQTSIAPALAKLHAQDASSSDTANSYATLLEQIINGGKPQSDQDLYAWLQSILGGPVTVEKVPFPHEALPLLSLRPLLTKFTQLLPQIQDNEMRMAAARAALELIAPRAVSFEEQDTALKLALADFLQQDEDFTAAANTLKQIPMEQSSRTMTDTDRVAIWIRIARCHLEEDDSTSAGSWIGRTKNLMHNVDNPELKLQFQLSHARILDAQRAFLEAASAYHTVSFEALVDEDDRLQTLSAAMKCAVLAPAGPQRARLLARLYKDDRASQTDEFPILENIFLDRLLSREEVARFADSLMPHQKALTADGSTVLDRAVLEHNLLAASRIYMNIKTDALGSLLGVDAERAEGYAAQMIEQGRLAGHIDQIEGLIFFEGRAGTGEKMKTGETKRGTGGLELRRWEADVAALAEDVEKVTTMVQSTFPDFYAAKMAQT